VTALIDVVGLCGGQTLKGVRLIVVGNGRHKTTLSFPRVSQGEDTKKLEECGEEKSCGPSTVLGFHMSGV
jgi:hypothetical protein